MIDAARDPATRLKLKAEPIGHQDTWRRIDGVKSATAEDIDWFDHRRLHGETSLIPPVEIEAAHAAERLSVSDPAILMAPAAEAQPSLYQIRDLARVRSSSDVVRR